MTDRHDAVTPGLQSGRGARGRLKAGDPAGVRSGGRWRAANWRLYSMGIVGVVVVVLIVLFVLGYFGRGRIRR